MKRHGFDAISFSFGLAFVALAGLLSMNIFDLGPHVLRWFGAAFLLFLGLLLLLTSRTRSEDRS